MMIHRHAFLLYCMILTVFNFLKIPKAALFYQDFSRSAKFRRACFVPIHFDLNRGCVPFCFAVLGTTKNSLLYQDSSGLLMKIMPIALQGIPHLFYSMNLLNLIE